MTKDSTIFQSELFSLLLTMTASSRRYKVCLKTEESSAKPRAYSPELQPVKLARILLFLTKQKEDHIKDYLKF